MSEWLSTGQSAWGRGTKKDATFIAVKAGIFLEEDECSCFIISGLEASYSKKSSRDGLKYFRIPCLCFNVMGANAEGWNRVLGPERGSLGHLRTLEFADLRLSH